MNNLEALILLNMVQGLGSVRLKKLLEGFKEPRLVFGAQAHALSATGALTPLMARSILEAPKRWNARPRDPRGRKERGEDLNPFG